MATAPSTDPSAFQPVEPIPAPPAPEPMEERAEPAASPIFYEGLELYQFSVEQYERFGECGILNGKERVFLLDGLLVRKMTIHPPHAIASDNLNPLLVRAVPEGWFVSNQNPVLMRPRNVPEPDYKIVRGRPNDYIRAHPGPGDVAIVIEISDSSIRLDQTVMKARYAAAGIPEYWIVNLKARRIEVYTDPTGPDSSPDYRRRADYGPEQSVPLVLDGREVAQITVRDVLPPEQNT